MRPVIDGNLCGEIDVEAPLMCFRTVVLKHISLACRCFQSMLRQGSSWTLEAPKLWALDSWHEEDEQSKEQEHLAL